MFMTIAISDVLARRASLLNPDGAIPVDVASSVTAEAKTSKNRNKADKKARKRCKRQAGQCSDFLIDACAGDAGCLETLTCCEFAGNCDIAGFLDCLIFRGDG
jgi:hypothetical protein